MKKYYLLVFGLLSLGTSAQNIYIEDPIMKLRILDSSPTQSIAKDANDQNITVDVNNDGEIQQSEADLVYFLNLSYVQDIHSIVGIEHFTNLTRLVCAYQPIAAANLNQNLNLQYINFSGNGELEELLIDQCIGLKAIWVDGNHLTELDLTLYPGLESINCENNQITELDFSNCPLLTSIRCEDNPILSIDVSNNPNLTTCWYANPVLEYLNIKNGLAGTLQNATYFNLYGCTSLVYLCCDAFEEADVLAELNQWSMDEVVVNGYCSFEPGGTVYHMNGNFRADLDQNGCSSNDPLISGVKYRVETQEASFVISGRNDGTYTIPVTAGDFTVTPLLESEEAYSITPESIAVGFPQENSPFLQDFCASGLNPVTDTKIHLIPVVPARPGFDAKYKLVYTNIGNTVESGTITFFFQESDRMDYVSSVPAPDVIAADLLTYTFENLTPFESREINISLNINSPVETPAVNVGDELHLSAHIVPDSSDPTPMNNGSGLKQIVVGSYDPNDKTCTSGPVAGPEVIGQYVDYVIRFENTGNYPAEFVVVKDLIDETQFDVSSLVPISASHDFYTRIEGNKVEFIFENIQLPFDDANNDGYVAFKIKTLPTLAVGDTFSNFASIYFDYNAPVITDPASTIIEELSVSEVDFASNFTLYPNPAENVLRIHSNGLEVKSVEIYNLLGQLVVTSIGSQDIDVSGLKSGNYLVRVNTQTGASVGRFVRK